MINRRGLITGLISFVAAPAIVRAESLMPVKAVKLPIFHIGDIVTFDGIHTFNRVTLESTDVLQQFVVTFCHEKKLSVYPFKDGLGIGESGLISSEHALKIGMKKHINFDYLDTYKPCQ